MKNYKEATIVCWYLQKIGFQTTLMQKAVDIQVPLIKWRFQRPYRHLPYTFKSPLADLDNGYSVDAV